MADNENTANATPIPADGRKRFKSEVAFPYADLESAIELAQTVVTKAGTSCALEELAVWMGQTADGGTFRTRVGAARMFGLVETGSGQVTVTQLGRDALDKSGVERAARVTAFLNVELFQALYDQNKGHPLPPLPAIERQIEGLGVSPKQKERARQTFNKSAIYAGFIDAASGRFIKPGIAGIKEERAADTRDDDRNKNRNGGGDGSGSDGLNLDPLLIALLKKIPEAEKGWPAAQRVRWFRTFAMNVSQIYDGEAMDPVELKIDLDEAAN
jgi:hypothetical protein